MAKKNNNSSLASAATIVNDHGNNVTKNSVVKVKRTRRSMPRDSPPQRSSIYRGVTRHRWTGRYEAHLWDKNCWNESQNKKGRQVYLGAYDDEETAAHAYDLAALKYWGQETILNFPLSTYENELKAMEGQSREEYIGSLRRKSSGFSRGVSKYRGVARHHHNGRWEARIGRVFGNKYLYLGTYATQEEAATAYDMAAIEYRGLNAVTNFDLSRYIKWLKPNNNNNQNDNKIVPTIQPDIGYNNPSSNLNSEVVTPSNINYVDTIPKHNQELAFFPKAGNNQQTSHEIVPAQPRPATATSALGLLLQSSKFKEMMEMTSVTDCPSIMVPNSGQIPQGSFPDDIQTYFDCQDLSNLVDDHSLFGELNSFVSPAMFHCDFDV